MGEADAIDQALLALIAERGPGKTICPSEVARALAPEAWRGVLPGVRRRAVALAKAGSIVIKRKGRVVDPDDFRGVYRLGLPE